jgi:hypothetical protein
MQTINNPENIPVHTTVVRQNDGWKTWAATGALVLLGGVSAFEFHRSSQMEDEIARLRTTTVNELNGLKETSASSAAATRDTLEQINAQLQTAQARANQAAGLARSNAAAVEKRTGKLLEELSTQQQARQAELDQTLGAMRAASEEQASKVGQVATEVGTVKTDVASTRSQLDQAISDMKSMRGDLGVQSGLIATNAKELSALRELGERNYFEFTVSKSDKVQKVGGIALALRKADPKRSKFSVDVLADDRRIEKKDKTMNEPVQFYVQGARQPLEIVINKVEKDRVTGYLATPKVVQARR